MIAYCPTDNISPIETYGKYVVSSCREVVQHDGKPMLYKAAVIKI